MLARPEGFRSELWTHQKELRAFAMALCKNANRADDLVQSTYLKALENEHRFEIGTNLAAWLFTILRNTFLSNIRKERRMQEDPGDMMANAMPCIDDPSRRIEAREILQLLEIMSPQFAVPLRMIADGASYDEVAAELGEHIGTIKSRIKRVRTMLGEP